MVRAMQRLAIAVLAVAGCATTPPLQHTAGPEVRQRDQQVQRLPEFDREVQLAAYTLDATDSVAKPVVHAVQQSPADISPPPEPLPSGATDSLAAAGVLDVDLVVAEVVARNASVQSMMAAWQAAAERYPQVVALDDPMLDVSVGPGSWGDPAVESAYMVMASQKFPWPGKRQLQGAIADSQANGAASQIEDVRLRLAEMAKLAFYDYFTAYRQLALNEDNLRDIREFRDTAEAKLRASLVTQQDVLQADVESAMLERRRNELQRNRKVAAARINTLLHRDADHPLPPPPDELKTGQRVPPIDDYLSKAMQRRPDLVAVVAEIQADEAAWQLAWKEFYPDVELYAKYDAFWQEHPLRSAVGVNFNVPLNKSRRGAGVREAESRLLQHRAEYERLVDEISNEVHASYARLLERHRTSRLFDEQIIPAAQKNVESARAGYAAGKVDFLRLIEAQRQLTVLREQQVEMVSDYHRRLAELDRAAAMPIETDE